MTFKAQTVQDQTTVRPFRNRGLFEGVVQLKKISGVEASRSMTEGSIRILTTLAKFHDLSRVQLGILTGYNPNGGAFRQYLIELKVKGWVEENGRVAITVAGLKAVQEFPFLSDRISMWTTKLRKGEGRILRVLSQLYPEEILKEDLAREVDMKYTSGTFRFYIRELLAAELIDQHGQLVNASEWLMKE